MHALEFTGFFLESTPDSAVAEDLEAISFGSTAEWHFEEVAFISHFDSFLADDVASSSSAEDAAIADSMSTSQEQTAFASYNMAAYIPDAPVIAAVGEDLNVDLTWGAVFGATSYDIYRSLTPGGPHSLLASGNTDTDYTDGSVTNGTTYYYVVKAVNGDGESPDSNEASATPQPTPPGAPTSLMAAGQITNIALAWTPPTADVPGYGYDYGGESYGGGSSNPATSYNVYRSAVMGGPYSILASGVAGPTHDDPSAVPGIPYYYVVRGVNAGGEGPDSNEATATAIPDPYVPPLVEFEVIVMWDPINNTLSMSADISSWPGKSIVEMTAFSGITDITPLLSNVGDPKILFIQSLEHPIKVDHGPGFPSVTAGKVFMINLEQGAPPFVRISAEYETDILAICAGNT